MLKVYRINSWYNINYVDVNGKAFEIDGIMIHDDENIITTSRWIQSKSCHNNSSIELNKPFILNDVECKLKRQHDFKELAYIIKEMDQTVNEIKTRLYLHVSLFNFTFKSIVNSCDYIENTYNDVEKDVYFYSWDQNLRKESSSIKTTMYNLVDELKDSRYDINKLETHTNKLKRLIKQYHAVYEKESNNIELLKTSLK